MEAKMQKSGQTYTMDYYEPNIINNNSSMQEEPWKQTTISCTYAVVYKTRKLPLTRKGVKQITKY